MKARRNGFASGVGTRIAAAALVVVALVAVIGSAQAAPSQKKFDALVYVADADPGDLTSVSAKLTITLKNDSTSKQTLGSANFVPPVGVLTGTPVLQSRPGWTVGKQGNVVTFRSTSNALVPGASVSADVTVGITPGTSAGQCGDATWTAFVKQSNDFSGTGNDFSPNAALSNLRPLGSFSMDPIETIVTEPDPDLHVPQILTSQAAAVRVTAFDICGAGYVGYGSGLGNDASLAPKVDTPARLQGATISAINWSNVTAVGTASLTPTVVETGDQLVVADPIKDVTGATVTTISDESNIFDVVEELCTSLNETCELSNGKIHVSGAGPPAADDPDDPVPSLGLGFSSVEFRCPGTGAPVSPIGGSLVTINPRDYPTNAPITVTVIYKKSDTGNGAATSFSVCLSKTNGQSWGAPLPECTNNPQESEAPCVSRKRVTGGDLSVAFFIRPTDPVGGIPKF